MPVTYEHAGVESTVAPNAVTLPHVTAAAHVAAAAFPRCLPCHDDRGWQCCSCAGAAAVDALSVFVELSGGPQRINRCCNHWVMQTDA